MLIEYNVAILISSLCTLVVTATVYLLSRKLKKLNEKKKTYKNKTEKFLLLASLLIKNKKFDDAQEIVSEVLAKSPKNLQALCLKATLLDYKGSHDEAMKIINKLKTKNKVDISLLGHPLAVRGYISDANLVYAEKIIKNKTKKIKKRKIIYLPSWWVDRIGHFCFLDSYIKMEKLRWIETRKKILLAPKGSISNPYLLSLYSSYFSEIVSDEALCQNLMSEVDIPENIFLGSYVNNKNHSCWWISKAWEAQYAWDKKGYLPLIQMSKQDKLFCQEKLKKFGIRNKDWFVCMHSRDSAFHQDKFDPPQDFRDTDFAFFEKSVQEVIRRGGWVFRMGDNKQKLTKNSKKKFVNYAFSSIKSDILDIYLASECLFFLGTNSGLSSVPALFNTPAMVANFLPIGTELFLKHGIFIPKLLFSKAEKRFLSFDEMMKEPIGQTHDGFMLDKFVIKNNTADEIKQGVVEMFESLSKKTLPKNYNCLHEKFQNIRRKNNVKCKIKIGSRFLQKYKKLL